uniref:Uncharacterized protein n=1 Tax=Anguilla anguilla TaxID=7936 RepID=A0A0E9UN62_ANGAN
MKATHKNCIPLTKKKIIIFFKSHQQKSMQTSKVKSTFEMEITCFEGTAQ